MILKSMFIYPVKSLRGIELKEAKMQIQGLEYDRRWMVLDENGEFLTQRNIPEMALVETEISDEFLILRKEGFGSVNVPLAEKEQELSSVMVWKDETVGYMESEEVSIWLTKVLGQKCSLTRMPSSAMRNSPKGEKQVSFADSQPVLIVNEKSLEELNSRLEVPILMSRFRANFVVEANEAWEEDNWKGFKIGKTEFEITKACGRCSVVTIEQETGEKVSKEPLTTLAKYRFFNKNVNFGMRAKWNETAVAEKEVLIKVGEKVVLF